MSKLKLLAFTLDFTNAPKGRYRRTFVTTRSKLYDM